jgi:hypothetical protein
MKNAAPRTDRQEDAGWELQQIARADELSSMAPVKEEDKKFTEPKYAEELIGAVRRRAVLSVELLLQKNRC